jgi:hypothetical protein
MFGLKKLQAGQWVRFSTPKPLDLLPEKQREIYQGGRCFLVALRQHEPHDPYRCMLVDIEGNKHDCCPRIDSLDLVDFADKTTVVPIDRAEVEKTYGADKVRSV